MAKTRAVVGDKKPARTAEALRRARFQNLIWREARARTAHAVHGSSAGPDTPAPDVPVEWLRELDHR